MNYEQISGDSLFPTKEKSWEDFDTFEDTIDFALKQMRDLMVKKQKYYGPMNIDSEIEIAFRAGDKMARLRNLLNKDTDIVAEVRKILEDDDYNAESAISAIDLAVNSGPENESIEDTWVDLANYGLIGLMYHNNAWGRPLAEEKREAVLDDSDVDEGNVY